MQTQPTKTCCLRITLRITFPSLPFHRACMYICNIHGPQSCATLPPSLPALGRAEPTPRSSASSGPVTGTLRPEAATARSLSRCGECSRSLCAIIALDSLNVTVYTISSTLADLLYFGYLYKPARSWSRASAPLIYSSCSASTLPSHLLWCL